MKKKLYSNLNYGPTGDELNDKFWCRICLKIAVKALVAGIVKSTVLQGSQLECSVGNVYVANRD